MKIYSLVLVAAVSLLLQLKGTEANDNNNRCRPGETFLADDGCNSCFCPNSGLRRDAACTRRFCPVKKQAPGQQCTPNEAFIADDGCNTCLCPENGSKRDAACTRRLCL
jgi:hypothetical protein